MRATKSGQLYRPPTQQPQRLVTRCTSQLQPAYCRCSAAEALAAVAAALEDEASLPKGLQPLTPLAPIISSALVARDSPDPAAGQAGDAADAADDGAAGANGAAGAIAPRRLPAITALLLAEVGRPLWHFQQKLSIYMVLGYTVAARASQASAS
jgi:hypothetical protein